MISCEQYDYIELVCLFRYPVQLILEDGSVLQGLATDTKRDESGAECIALEIHSIERLVVLDQLEKLTILIQNPHFIEVSFNSPNKPTA